MRHREILREFFLLAENKPQRISQILKIDLGVAEKIQSLFGHNSFVIANLLKLLGGFSRNIQIDRDSILDFITRSLNYKISTREEDDGIELDVNDVQRLINDQVFEKESNKISSLQNPREEMRFIMIAIDRLRRLDPQKFPRAESILNVGPYHWVDLKSCASSEEGHKMGHCGVAFLQGSQLYSLRDSKDEPHVTLEYNPKLHQIVQVKGRGDTKPHDKYQEAIDAMAKHLGF